MNLQAACNGPRGTYPAAKKYLRTMKKHDDQTVAKVSNETEELKKQADEWKNKYLRALADYQNLEKRTDERVSDVRSYAAELILMRLLPVVDTFTKVKAHIKDPGFDLAFKELETVLKEQGIDRMQVAGKDFDPTTMECIEVVPGKDNAVVEETLPGYLFRGKVLRVAQVKVGKKDSAQIN